MKLTKEPDHDWATKAQTVWERKSGLREYYHIQIFDRIVSEIITGTVLQLGTGPGFFARYHSGMINSDITLYDQVDTVADVHSLPFKDACFDNVVGVDVLHHFARPGDAMKECARILRPGGRVILVEPWAGWMGRHFFKYIHHEDCANVEDPWSNAFPGTKKPMEGNAAIPAIVFHERVHELPKYVPDLHFLKKWHFGSLSFLLTGGMQEIGLPAPIIRFFYRLEGLLPQAVMGFIALRALFVLEKRHHHRG